VSKSVINGKNDGTSQWMDDLMNAQKLPESKFLIEDKDICCACHQIQPGTPSSSSSSSRDRKCNFEDSTDPASAHLVIVIIIMLRFVGLTSGLWGSGGGAAMAATADNKSKFIAISIARTPLSPSTQLIKLQQMELFSEKLQVLQQEHQQSHPNQGSTAIIGEWGSHSFNITCLQLVVASWQLALGYSLRDPLCCLNPNTAWWHEVALAPGTGTLLSSDIKAVALVVIVTTGSRLLGRLRSINMIRSRNGVCHSSSTMQQRN
jgi:hypothetical protein